ncbi:MAG: NADH-quinone oxidoreductase subunit J [Firmicutes bacterium]|nr:NADH-quinone oxidoreductase subunit J [Alicyclobacillaceae bacterium]MCL6497497.1 NADH-quinone oxidoreductase subunit J [Bacillota bacterium]
MWGVYLVGIIAVLAAVGVVAARQPVHSAISLILNILALALLYLMLSAEFLAAAQVIVYAGAIMVLFLFVVTLLTAGKEEQEAPEILSGQRWWAGGLSVAIGLVLVLILAQTPSSGLGPAGPVGTLNALGAALWGRGFPYLLAVAMMLLTAALGVLVLNRPERPSRSSEPGSER